MLEMCKTEEHDPSLPWDITPILKYKKHVYILTKWMRWGRKHNKHGTHVFTEASGMANHWQS